MALEVALSVQQELQVRCEETDRLRRQQVERARYEAELGRRRYMQVDPDNRLVADELEAEWNRRLRALTDAQEEYGRQRHADRAVLDEEQRRRILALATDFPRLWQAPGTPDRERKRHGASPPFPGRGEIQTMADGSHTMSDNIVPRLRQLRRHHRDRRARRPP
jgi:hypothetical protein